MERLHLALTLSMNYAMLRRMAGGFLTASHPFASHPFNKRFTLFCAIASSPPSPLLRNLRSAARARRRRPA
jgi:hypothetical protein